MTTATIKHKTGIQWTHRSGTIGATWNPVSGCSHVSPGCVECYAEAISLRFKRSIGKWTAANAAQNVVLHPEKIGEPLKWRRPHTIFVNSMSDLWHEQVPDEFICQLFTVMRQTPQHVYQILTKRPERMLTFMQHLAWRTPTQEERDQGAHGWQAYLATEGAAPLPNVWCGVSVEDQRRADERIPLLLQTPASVRFLSCEPLLGEVDLTHYIQADEVNSGYGHYEQFGWGYDIGSGGFIGRGSIPYDPKPGLDWVIVGGESGPRARPMDVEWAESLLDQCRTANVSAFMKQMGTRWAKDHKAQDGHAGEPSEWPEHLRIRQWPQTEVA